MEEDEEVTGFFPNLENSRIVKRGIGAQPLLESQIKAAQSISASAFEAARTLGVSYNTYKKYAKLYGIFDDLKNPYGIGIHKAKAIKNKKYHIDDLIAGKTEINFLFKSEIALSNPFTFTLIHLQQL
jgi:hypothetical protein